MKEMGMTITAAYHEFPSFWYSTIRLSSNKSFLIDVRGV